MCAHMHMYTQTTHTLLFSQLGKLCLARKCRPENDFASLCQQRSLSTEVGGQRSDCSYLLLECC